MLKVFTAFTGIGSQEIALKELGIDIDIVGISEVDKNALLAYDAIHNENYNVEYPSKEEMLNEFKVKNIAYNFSTGKSEIPKNIDDIKHLYNAHIKSKNYGDIRLINPIALPDFDLFTYSFPCKNISVAGKQAGLEKGSETQSSLIWECEKIIKTKQPKYLLMENVKNLLSPKHKNILDTWIELLNQLGYESYYSILNAKDYGVPQNRERTIMVSITKELNQTFTFPKKFDNGTRVKHLLENNVDKKYHVPLEKVEHLIEKLKNREISNTIRVGGRGSLGKHEWDLVYQENKLIYIGDITQKGIDSNKRVYHADGLCPTITAMQGGNRQSKIGYKSDPNFVIRRLTPLECWRLMGYKDEYYYKAKNIGQLSDSKLYERAGRGIVIPMLKEIFKNMLIYE